MSIPRNRTWSQFTKDPKNKDLTLEEQKKRYKLEQQRWQQHESFINSGLYKIR